MRSPLVFVLGALLLGSCEEASQPTADITIDFSDEGLGNQSAKAVFEVISRLVESTEQSLLVRFENGKEAMVFSFLGPNSFNSQVSIDPMDVRFSVNHVVCNDEQFSLGGFTDLIDRYIEAARLTDSRPFIVVGFSPVLNLSQAVSYLRTFSDQGVIHLSLYSTSL